MDDAKVPTGTRYDALRMVAMDEPSRALVQLKRYLGAQVNAELQMGAVSGLADVRSPAATAALQSALEHLTPANRKLAQAGIDRHRQAARE